MDPQNPIDPVANTLSQISREVDWRSKFRLTARLALICFSLFIAVVAGVELDQVHAANSWPAQPARLISVTLEHPTRQGHDPYWRYSFKLTKTGERGHTTDVRPGDFPFRFLFMSTHHWDAERYRAGQTINIHRAPEGGKAYLERGGYGLMSAVLTAVFAFWASLFLRRVKAAKAPS